MAKIIIAKIPDNGISLTKHKRKSIGPQSKYTAFKKVLPFLLIPKQLLQFVNIRAILNLPIFF